MCGLVAERDVELHYVWSPPWTHHFIGCFERVANIYHVMLLLVIPHPPLHNMSHNIYIISLLCVEWQISSFPLMMIMMKRVAIRVLDLCGRRCDYTTVTAEPELLFHLLHERLQHRIMAESKPEHFLFSFVLQKKVPHYLGTMVRLHSLHSWIHHLRHIISIHVYVNRILFLFFFWIYILERERDGSSHMSTTHTWHQRIRTIEYSHHASADSHHAPTWKNMLLPLFFALFILLPECKMYQHIARGYMCLVGGALHCKSMC